MEFYDIGIYHRTSPGTGMALCNFRKKKFWSVAFWNNETLTLYNRHGPRMHVGAAKLLRSGTQYTPLTLCAHFCG